VKWARASGFVLAVASAAACSPDPVNLGPTSGMLWWTDHETGDTSDWLRGAEGSTWTAAGGQLDVVTSPVRSGHYALRSAILSSPDGVLSAAVVQRAGPMPVDAFYSAWYYVPAAATTTNYWLFFKFRSRCVASDPSTGAEVWDVDFLPDGNGGMRFGLYGHVKGANEPPLAMPSVPIGRWFQVEAFLRVANDNTGQLTIWVDDTMIFDVQGRPTMPTASLCVEWSIGGITGTITPASATFYVDDAAISTRRLGPQFPIFWRAD